MSKSSPRISLSIRYCQPRYPWGQTYISYFISIEPQLSLISTTLNMSQSPCVLSSNCGQLIFCGMYIQWLGLDGFFIDVYVGVDYIELQFVLL